MYWLGLNYAIKIVFVKRVCPFCCFFDLAEKFLCNFVTCSGACKYVISILFEQKGMPNIGLIISE